MDSRKPKGSTHLQFNPVAIFHDEQGKRPLTHVFFKKHRETFTEAVAAYKKAEKLSGNEALLALEQADELFKKSRKTAKKIKQQIKAEIDSHFPQQEDTPSESKHDKPVVPQQSLFKLPEIKQQKAAVDVKKVINEVDARLSKIRQIDHRFLRDIFSECASYYYQRRKESSYKSSRGLKAISNQFNELSLAFGRTEASMNLKFSLSKFKDKYQRYREAYDKKYCDEKSTSGLTVFLRKQFEDHVNELATLYPEDFNEKVVSLFEHLGATLKRKYADAFLFEFASIMVVGVSCHLPSLTKM